MTDPYSFYKNNYLREAHYTNLNYDKIIAISITHLNFYLNYPNHIFEKYKYPL
jgi:hypothetical protein